VSLVGIASVYFVGWLDHKTHFLVPKPVLQWTPSSARMSPYTLRIHGQDWSGTQLLEGKNFIRSITLPERLNATRLTESFHESALAELGLTHVDKKRHASFLRRFFGWETPLEGRSRLRTLAGDYVDSTLLIQTIDTFSDFDPERRLEMRGWLRSTGIGYPWVVLDVGALLLLAVIVFMLFATNGFLWSMRVEPPDSALPLSGGEVSDRLRTLIPLAENRGFHELAPGIFQCAWSKHETRTRKLKAYDVQSEDWLRIRLDPAKSTAFLISGSTIATKRNDVFNFFRAKEWMRSAGHLPITPIEDSWITWDGTNFVITRTRDQNVDELVQAISHCVLDSGWTMQPHLW